MQKEVVIPDLGSNNPVDVIEILVKVGDTVVAETPLLTLESDKASMDVPAPFAGVIKEIRVKIGQQVTPGTVVFLMETAAAQTEKPAAPAKTEQPAATPAQTPVTPTPDSKPNLSTETTLQDIKVPDLGNNNPVEVIEILGKVGDKITLEQALITLESDKASMDVPSPVAGELTALLVKVGDKVTSGTKIATIKTQQTSSAKATTTEAKAPASTTSSPEQTITNQATTSSSKELPANAEVYAGPAVRRFARELGVDLNKVKGTGRKGRIQQEDVQAYVKSIMSNPTSSSNNNAQGGFSLPASPIVDFAQFGEIETQPLSRIKKISGANLQRNWIVVPHVTQFDEADITELEAFRQSTNQDAAKQGLKITPLVFIMKAVVGGLKAYPTFNASLDASGTSLILKKYYHIGVAVDTPNGLVVAVIRDVDKKGIYDLSAELATISEKARTKGLAPSDMQGSSFTISSLGGIGGTAFTPIVNLPDVAILGVSRSSMKPVYQDGQFVPRLMLPLSLSYDHRVIDGAAGARFTRYLTEMLADVRKLLL